MSKTPVVLFLSGFVLGIIPVILHTETREEKTYDSIGLASVPKQKSPALSRSQSEKKVTKKAPSIDNLKSFLKEYGALSPQKAGDTLCQLVDEDSELNSFDITYFLARELGKNYPEEARRLLEEQKNKPYQENFPKEALIRGWAEADWSGAFDYLLKNIKGFDTDYFFQTIMKDRVLSAPEEALSWLSSQSEETRVASLMPVMQGLAEAHPEYSARFVATMQPGDLNDVYLLGLVAETLPKSDWETAMKWFKSLSDITRGEYASVAYESLAEANPKRATEEFLNWDVNQDISPGLKGLMERHPEQFTKREKRQNERFASAIVEALQKHSPVEAAQWIENNISENKAVYIRHVAVSAESQTPEFTEYVAQMPKGEMRDSALYSMMQSRSKMEDKSHFSLKDTLALASGINDENLRNKTIEENINIWISTSPENVLEWASSSRELPDDKKKNYMEKSKESLRQKNNPSQK